MNSNSTNLEQHSSTHRETPETQQREQPLLPRRRRLFFAARDTLAATLAAEKEIARLMSPPKGGRARARDEREEMEGGNARETEREREREGGRCVGRVTISRGLVGRGCNHHPPPPPLRLCPSVKRNNYYRKSGAHACGKPRRDPELH